MRPRPITVAALVVFASVLAGAQGPGADPINGTWKLNIARSSFSPGPPPPVFAAPTHRFSSVDGGWSLFEMSGLNAQGDPAMQLLAFKIDGQQYPVYNNATLRAFSTTGKPTNVTRSYRRIDAYTTEYITYTNGVAGIPTIRTVAKDGKSYTETVKGKNAQGQDVHNVRVFDRVY